MDINSLFGSAGTWEIVKIMFLFGMFLYIVFAFVVLRQITHMTKTLRMGFESPIKLLGIIHFAFAILLFIFATIYL